MNTLGSSMDFFRKNEFGDKHNENLIVHLYI